MLMFEQWLKDVECGRYQACMASPPSQTFSTGANPPTPFRAWEGPHSYGLPGLKPGEREAVKIENILADREHSCLDWFSKSGLP